MDCKDLMVGDYIHRPDCIDKVVEIRKNGIIGIDSLRGLIDFQKLQPIPITGDILEKNGFRKNEDANEWAFYESRDGKGQYMILWSMDYNYLEIGSYVEDFGEFNRLGVMRYVHQLQHALRLCGIEKELTI